MKDFSLHLISKFKFTVFSLLLFVNLFLLPDKIFADNFYDFVKLEIAVAYLQKYPYIITVSNNPEYPSYVFKAEKVYMEENRMMVSGPVVLKYTTNSFNQRTYYMPDADGEIYTDELCGNCHYGFYYAMRTAFPLVELLTSTGGIYNSSSRTLPFPDPEVIPDVEKNYTMWLDQLPAVVKDYCLWWYQNASIGPPVLHELIDSVLSIPEGGSKMPPESFIDYNHCPGEGCQFGEWNTTADITVFDKPQSTKIIGKISAGESFTAISGNVFLIPKEEIVAEEIEVYDSTGSIILEPGRRYYILSYISEGHSNVWVNGRIMISSDCPYNESQQWWVKIKTKKGKEGWILYPENGSISGNDYLE